MELHPNSELGLLIQRRDTARNIAERTHVSFVDESTAERKIRSTVPLPDGQVVSIEEPEGELLVSNVIIESNGSSKDHPLCAKDLAKSLLGSASPEACQKIATVINQARQHLNTTGWQLVQVLPPDTKKIKPQDIMWYLKEPKDVVWNQGGVQALNLQPIVEEPVVVQESGAQSVQETALQIQPAEQHVAVAEERKVTLSPDDAATAFAMIVDSIPEDVLNDIYRLTGQNGKLTRLEIANIAQLIVDFKTGKRLRPNAGNFLQARDEGEAVRLGYAKDSLAAIIAFAVAPDGSIREKTLGSVQRIGKEINRLQFLLGNRDGRRLVVEAISQLPAAQRTLLFRSMSTNIKEKLGYPDIDECTEKQMGEYIQNASYTGQKPETTPRRRTADLQPLVPADTVDKLATLIDACDERAGVDLDIRKVITYLLEHTSDKNREEIFATIIEAGEAGDFLGMLRSFFQAHERTFKYAVLSAQKEGLEFNNYHEDEYYNDLEFSDEEL